MQMEIPTTARHSEPSLRPYQQRAVEMLYRWFEAGNSGNPCLVMPTGSGKSHVIAHLCKDAITRWPETRVLLLTHVRELITQDLDKLIKHWPGAPVGVYSAGLGRKELGHEITFAGIQSIRAHAADVGHVDIAIVDESHLISHEDQGGYRTFLGELLAINPALRVVGLTATPYRLGHVLITDKPAVFDALIEPLSIEELVHSGYLAPLRSKVTIKALDVGDVHKRGGEYIESELQAAVNKPEVNLFVADEIMVRAGQRRAWLLFCAGVAHAQEIASLLSSRGVPAACVTGETPKPERDRILDDFRSGRLRAVTNANVLTTGFDYPDIDLIAMLRPTCSPGLYVQMAGRGMRVKSHTDHCLVLDFAGNVQMHGPITSVRAPDKAKKAGEAPHKTCPECMEIVTASTRTCPACGFEFPREDKKKNLELHDDDIMGAGKVRTMEIENWRWARHVGRASGKEMLRVDYYGKDLGDPIVKEYLCVLHDGYAQAKALRALNDIATHAGVWADIQGDLTLDEGARVLESGRAPTEIKYKADGKFFRVTSRKWGADEK